LGPICCRRSLRCVLVRAFGKSDAAYQFFQTFHQKPLIGGYLSRISAREIRRQHAVITVHHLLRLSEGQSISGEPFRSGTTGAPILERTPAFVECRLVDTVERGDHSVFVGEVVEAGVAKPIEGRADDATLWLKELGPNVFYGG